MYSSAGGYQYLSCLSRHEMIDYTILVIEKEKKSLLCIVKQREDYVKQNNEDIGICERKFYKMITLHFQIWR